MKNIFGRIYVIKGDFMIAINDKDIVITLEEYKDKKINVDIKLLEVNNKLKYNLKNEKYIFTIKFTNNIKESIKKLKALKKLVKKGVKFGIDYNGKNLLGIIENASKEIELCIKTIFIKNRDKRYEFLYDSICDILDEKWNKTNPCDFKENICVEERNCANHPRKNGCCYAFWYSKNPLKIEGIHQCEFLDTEKYCTNKNISCKLFVCPYLKKRRIFKINKSKMILIQVFLNRYQKLVLEGNFFVPREEFIEKIKKEEKRFKPFLVYYSSRDYMIYKHTPKDKRKIAKKYDKIYKQTNGLRKF